MFIHERAPVVDPKPKPRKGQTQEENEQEFEDIMELSTYEGTVALDTNFDTSVSYASDNWTTTSGVEPEFIDFQHDSVTVTFRRSEAQHQELRKRYPALEKAYDHYCTLLALAQNGPEDLDN